MIESKVISKKETRSVADENAITLKNQLELDRDALKRN
jgi:hypothetical protein